MVLSWVYAALKRVLENYVDRQRSKPRCGIWPFQFASSFRLTECCAIHDTDYTQLRAEALALAEHGKVDLEAHPEWLGIFQVQVKKADYRFAVCVRTATEGSAWGMFFAELFIEIVASKGWDVWRSATLDAWEDMKKIRVIQEAISLAEM